MYKSVEHLKLNDGQRFRSTVRATNKRFTVNKGIIGPSDWYLKEFSRDTLQYFKANAGPKIKKLTAMQKLE